MGGGWIEFNIAPAKIKAATGSGLHKYFLLVYSGAIPYNLGSKVPGIRHRDEALSWSLRAVLPSVPHKQ
jgi:hypothetical protein